MKSELSISCTWLFIDYSLSFTRDSPESAKRKWVVEITRGIEIWKLEHLSLNTNYFLTIRARTAGGQGPDSPEVIVSTYALVGEKPPFSRIHICFYFADQILFSFNSRKEHSFFRKYKYPYINVNRYIIKLSIFQFIFNVNWSYLVHHY